MPTMQMTRRRFVALATWLLCASVSFQAGCNSPNAGGPSAEPAAGPAVNLDRTDNGAAVRLTRRAPRDDRRLQRPLSFVMTGSAPFAAGDSTTDSRAAATQAAVIDALFAAVVENRRDAGESIVNFTQHLGPRVSLTHLSLEGRDEIRVKLASTRGESEFVVRDGVLTHPPYDFETLRRVFEATDGEFSLLETRRDALQKSITARVGCYGSVTTGTAIVADVEVEDEIPDGS